MSGRLPPEVIQRIVRQNLGRMRACYLEELRARPQVGGRVTARFRIHEDGTTRATKVESPFSAELNACIARGFSSIRFPSTQWGHIEVLYPLVFAPANGGPRWTWDRTRY